MVSDSAFCVEQSTNDPIQKTRSENIAEQRPHGSLIKRGDNCPAKLSQPCLWWILRCTPIPFPILSSTHKRNTFQTRHMGEISTKFRFSQKKLKNSCFTLISIPRETVARSLVRSLSESHPCSQQIPCELIGHKLLGWVVLEALTVRVIHACGHPS